MSSLAAASSSSKGASSSTSRRGGEGKEKEKDHGGGEEQGKEKDKGKDKEKGKGKEKQKVMSESGQTDTFRRALRGRLRALASDVQTAGADLEDSSKPAFSEVRQATNALFTDVAYVREAVLEGEVLCNIAQRASKQANRLVSANTYDIDKVLRGLIKKSSLLNEEGLDWAKFGSACGAVFNKVPVQSFMAGPVGKPVEAKVVKERVARKKRVDDQGEEVRPDEVTQQGGKADKHGLSGMENIIATFDKTLYKRDTVGTSAAGATSLVTLVVNPQSFTQTCENLLALSFQLKKGVCRVTKDGSGLPVVHRTNLNDLGLGVRAAGEKRKGGDDDDGAKMPQGSSKQSVLALNMRQWRDLVQVYGVGAEDGMPHRASKREKKE